MGKRFLKGTGSIAAAAGLIFLGNLFSTQYGSTVLRTMSTAEADYRSNDRDWNHVNDFWTGDVSGLYHVKPAPEGNPEIRLIEESVANSSVAS